MNKKTLKVLEDLANSNLDGENDESRWVIADRARGRRVHVLKRDYLNVTLCGIFAYLQEPQDCWALYQKCKRCFK